MLGILQKCCVEKGKGEIPFTRLFKRVVFPGHLIPVLYTITVIAGAFIYGPIVLLGLLFSIPFLLFVALIKLKAYPTMKRNYLSK